MNADGNLASTPDEGQNAINVPNKYSKSPYTTKFQKRWNTMFEELKLFEAKHLHVDVPKKDAEKPQLGQWVSTQRSWYKNYKAGNTQKSSGMCEERINKLESIGFNWVSEYTYMQHTWDEMFEELKLFKAKHRHTDVSTTDADNTKLGTWVKNQRQGYKNYKAGNKQKSKGMCEKRINKLESMALTGSMNMRPSNNYGMKGKN